LIERERQAERQTVLAIVSLDHHQSSSSTIILQRQQVLSQAKSRVVLCITALHFTALNEQQSVRSFTILSIGDIEQLLYVTIITFYIDDNWYFDTAHSQVVTGRSR
jgi:hypothetical protein